ncbi:nuclear transport factor 2 family protein [Pinirhizobacter soli]|uniref:nuclear transport factor 2 family protein n=1 Tax=Pinirhizobacter soli TaxID=2786953 RepID=UPI002029CCBF|nr:nuclear transport factor 2 family protein [Pinirhizobacter soli]
MKAPRYAAAMGSMLLLVAGLAQAGNPKLPPDLAKAAADYDQAQVHSDRVGLEKALADDWVLANSAGKTQTKQEFIAESVAPGSSVEPYTVQDETIRVWGDGATLAGLVDFKGTSEGKPFQVRMRFVDVWRKKDGRWQVVYTQAARVP